MQPSLSGAVSQEHDAEAHTVAQPHPAGSCERAARGDDHDRDRHAKSRPVLAYRRAGCPKSAEDDQRRGTHIDAVDDPVTRPLVDEPPMNTYTATSATAKAAPSARR
jgi:hypothetical protein